MQLIFLSLYRSHEKKKSWWIEIDDSPTFSLSAVTNACISYLEPLLACL